MKKVQSGYLRTRALVASVVLLAALTVVTSSVGVTGASGAASVRGFDGKAIKIAGIGQAASFAGADMGAKARFKRANDNNEIKGVTLEYTEFADDKADPAVATSEIRRLVTQEQIFGIVPDLSAVNPGAYLNQQHVPYVGFAFDGTYCSPKPTTKLYGFGWSGCAVPDNPPFMPDNYSAEYKYVAEKTGKKNPSIVIFSNDNQSGKHGVPLAATSAQGAGFKVVYAKGTVPITTSDYSPYVQEYITADAGKQPDDIHCNLATQCIPIWSALKAAGFTGTFWTPLGIDLFAKPLSGTIASGFYNTAPSAGLTQMKTDFAAAGVPATTPLFAEVAYFSADMFIQALKTVVKKGGAKAITPEAVQKVLATQTWQIKGLAGPTQYPASTVVSTPSCSQLTTSNGTAPWEVVEAFACRTKTYKIDHKFTG